MAKDLKIANDDAPPPWMREKSVGAELGNLDISDYTPPRLKLIAATSKELAEEPDARAGSFWLTGAKLNLGPEVIGTLIILRKSIVLWDPSRESKVPLAISTDGVRWDAGYENQTFEVFFPNNYSTTPFIWKTKRSVAESGLDRFGSSFGDKKSPPAASLTYQMLWAIKLPFGGTTVALVTNSRSNVRAAKDAFEMMKARGVDHYYQRYGICSDRVKRKTGDSTYFAFKYFFRELVKNEEEAESYRRLYEGYRKAGFSTGTDDEDISGSRGDENDVEVKRGGGAFKTLNTDDLEPIPF